MKPKPELAPHPTPTILPRGSWERPRLRLRRALLTGIAGGVNAGLPLPTPAVCSPLRDRLPPDWLPSAKADDVPYDYAYHPSHAYTSYTTPSGWIKLCFDL